MPAAREVVFTDYALLRMHQRDIDEDDVHRALDAPSSRHVFRNDGRAEARERIDRRGVLLVVYRRDADVFVVINAMWER